MFPSPFRPFGEAASEHEFERYQEEIRDLFYQGTEFNNQSMKPETFLIVGRRGSGKTALSHYFHFQEILPNASAVTVNEPTKFEHQITKMVEATGDNENEAVERTSRFWETVIWGLVFDQLKDVDPKVRAACIVKPRQGRSASALVKRLAADLFESYVGKDGYIDEIFDEYIEDSAFSVPKEICLQYMQTYPLIVAIDSYERYDVNNRSLMMSISGLVQCASKFNLKHSSRGLHVKVFLSAEIYPHVAEDAVLNTAKFVEAPVYLHWRPRELARIICWRFHHFLEQHNLLLDVSKGDIDWDSWPAVREKMWNPYFGERLANGTGISENTFPYILRHTQNRPRQLIKICNKIADISREGGRFPLFSPEDVVNGISSIERDLAREVINSFARIYPNCGKIVQALANLGPRFQGSELWKIGSRTSDEWVSDRYSAQGFVRLVAELGIVGKIRDSSKRAFNSVEADFEYFDEDTMLISESDDCVLHPMFYKRFGTVPRYKDRSLIVYPFPDHPSFKEIED